MNNSVVIVLENYPACGGVERVSTLLANFLCEQGWRVAIVSLAGSADPALRTALHAHVCTRSLPDSARPASARNGQCLAAIVEQQRATVILNQGLHFGLTRLSLAVAARAGCRHVGVLHNTPDAQAHILDARRASLRAGGAADLKSRLMRMGWPLYRALSERKMARFYRRVYRDSAAVVLLSPSFGAPFAALARLPESNKIVCIPNPLTFDDEPGMAMPDKEKTLIYIGRFDRTQKRVDRVVTIFKALRDRYPDWQLQLVGDGEQRAELEQMSEGIAAITFAGTVADPREYLKRASILLLTSEFEGFGMVLTEALQFGVVPVAYDSYTALRDIVSDGRNGFAVAPFDQQRFIGRLDELMGNPDQLAAMGVAAMNSASRFRKTAVLPQWLPVLAATANLESAI